MDSSVEDFFASTIKMECTGRVIHGYVHAIKQYEGKRVIIEFNALSKDAFKAHVVHFDGSSKKKVKGGKKKSVFSDTCSVDPWETNSDAERAKGTTTFDPVSTIITLRDSGKIPIFARMVLLELEVSSDNDVMRFIAAHRGTRTLTKTILRNAMKSESKYISLMQKVNMGMKDLPNTIDQESILKESLKCKLTLKCVREVAHNYFIHDDRLTLCKWYEHTRVSLLCDEEVRTIVDLVSTSPWELACAEIIRWKERAGDKRDLRWEATSATKHLGDSDPAMYDSMVSSQMDLDRIRNCINASRVSNGDGERTARVLANRLLVYVVWALRIISHEERLRWVPVESVVALLRCICCGNADHMRTCWTRRKRDMESDGCERRSKKPRRIGLPPLISVPDADELCSKLRKADGISLIEVRNVRDELIWSTPAYGRCTTDNTDATDGTTECIGFSWIGSCEISVMKSLIAICKNNDLDLGTLCDREETTSVPYIYRLSCERERQERFSGGVFALVTHGRKYEEYLRDGARLLLDDPRNLMVVTSTKERKRKLKRIIGKDSHVTTSASLMDFMEGEFGLASSRAYDEDDITIIIDATHSFSIDTFANTLKQIAFDDNLPRVKCLVIAGDPFCHGRSWDDSDGNVFEGLVTSSALPTYELPYENIQDGALTARWALSDGPLTSDNRLTLLGCMRGDSSFSAMKWTKPDDTNDTFRTVSYHHNTGSLMEDVLSRYELQDVQVLCGGDFRHAQGVAAHLISEVVSHIEKNPQKTCAEGISLGSLLNPFSLVHDGSFTVGSKIMMCNGDRSVSMVHSLGEKHIDEEYAQSLEERNVVHSGSETDSVSLYDMPKMSSIQDHCCSIDWGRAVQLTSASHAFVQATCLPIQEVQCYSIPVVVFVCTPRTTLRDMYSASILASEECVFLTETGITSFRSKKWPSKDPPNCMFRNMIEAFKKYSLYS